MYIYSSPPLGSDPGPVYYTTAVFLLQDVRSDERGHNQ